MGTAMAMTMDMVTATVMEMKETTKKKSRRTFFQVMGLKMTIAKSGKSVKPSLSY